MPEKKNPKERTENEALLLQAKCILVDNWTGSFTKPAPKLYPHQWNWDAGFIAIGYAHYATERAEQELRSLFRGQWQNGMVPHIVFNPAAVADYFPGPDFWQTERSPYAPAKPQTSGLTMPPVHATAALHIYRQAKNQEAARDFLQEMFPKLCASHRYFYSQRDPQHEGLVYIRHPWESGTDNAPTWDAALQRIDLSAVQIPPYRRKDLDVVSAAQRPTAEDYDRYVYLVDLFRRHDYDDRRIYEECPFLIQDPLFNSLLCKANEDLLEIAKILGRDGKEIEEWHQQTRRAMNQKLWDKRRSIYNAFDLLQNKPIPMSGISGAVPLFAGIPSEKQSQQLHTLLRGPGFGGANRTDYFLFPSYDLQSDRFDPRKYWRGPVWINMNWLLYHGLQRYGFGELARAVRQDSLELIRRFGFYEYFTPFRQSHEEESGGYGSEDFSWTAALCIDFLCSAKL